jgi:hypothetical protein
MAFNQLYVTTLLNEGECYEYGLVLRVGVVDTSNNAGLNKMTHVSTIFSFFLFSKSMSSLPLAILT